MKFPRFYYTIYWRRKSPRQSVTTSDKAFSNLPEQVSIAVTREIQSFHTFRILPTYFISFVYNYPHSLACNLLLFYSPSCTLYSVVPLRNDSKNTNWFNALLNLQPARIDILDIRSTKWDYINIKKKYQYIVNKKKKII